MIEKLSFIHFEPDDKTKVALLLVKVNEIIEHLSQGGTPKSERQHVDGGSKNLFRRYECCGCAEVFYVDAHPNYCPACGRDGDGKLRSIDKTQPEVKGGEQDGYGTRCDHVWPSTCPRCDASKAACSLDRGNTGSDE